jgi:hypothetical protein
MSLGDAEEVILMRTKHAWRSRRMACAAREESAGLYEVSTQAVS